MAQARNSREAVEQFETRLPDTCSLDVRMPGLSDVEAARHIGRRPRIVYVTAFDKYAVLSFEQPALDYLVNPLERASLADTVARLRERLLATRPALDAEALIDQLSAHLRRCSTPAALQWIRASVG